jgi:hypothetical protein
MAKRLLALSFAFVLCFALFACGDGDAKKADELYAAANERLETVTKGMDVTYTVSMTMGDQTRTMASDIKLQIVSDTAINVAMKTYSDEELQMEMTYVDGWFYTSMGETKVKMEMSLEDLGMDLPELLDEEPSEALAAALQAAEVEKKDGNYEFSYTITGDALIAQMEKEGMLDLIGIEDMSADFISSYSTKIVIDEDSNLVSQTTVFSVTYEGETAQFTYSIVVNNPGTAVTVTAPADADSYIATPDLF